MFSFLTLYCFLLCNFCFLTKQNQLSIVLWHVLNLICMVSLAQKRTKIWFLAAACGSRFVWLEEFTISSLFAAAVVKQPAAVVVGSRSLELFFLLLVLCCFFCHNCFCCHLPSLPLGRSPSAKVQRVLQLLLFLESGCLQNVHRRARAAVIQLAGAAVPRSFQWNKRGILLFRRRTSITSNLICKVVSLLR